MNAVLRKVAAEGPDAWPKMRVPRLPDWLRDPLIMAWGAEAVTGMERAQFAMVHHWTITLKPGATGPGEALPTGSMRVQDAGQVSACRDSTAGRLVGAGCGGRDSRAGSGPEDQQRRFWTSAPRPAARRCNWRPPGPRSRRWISRIRGWSGCARTSGRTGLTAEGHRGRRAGASGPIRRHPAGRALFRHRHHSPPP